MPASVASPSTTADCPRPSRRLLSLLDAGQPPPPPPRRGPPLLARLGEATTGALAGTGELSSLLGSLTMRAGAASMGRARMRTTDLLDNLYDAGPAALLIVTVVNVLVGAILAFVGVVQLRRLAADSFVANLVGLALVREMVPVMTAIIMAGRHRRCLRRPHRHPCRATRRSMRWPPRASRSATTSCCRRYCR